MQKLEKNELYKEKQQVERNILTKIADILVRENLLSWRERMLFEKHINTERVMR